MILIGSPDAVPAEATTNAETVVPAETEAVDLDKVALVAAADDIQPISPGEFDAPPPPDAPPVDLNEFPSPQARCPYGGPGMGMGPGQGRGNGPRQGQGHGCGQAMGRGQGGQAGRGQRNSMGRGQRNSMGRGQRNSMGRGQGRGFGRGQGPFAKGDGPMQRIRDAKGRGRGQGPGQGYGRGRDRRGPQADPDELINFLEEHQPELAKQLTELRNEKPWEFKEKLAVLGKVYGPVIHQMKYDPTMAAYSLAKLQRRLQIKQAHEQYEAADPGSQEQLQAMQQLNSLLAEQFDTIVEEEALKLERFKTQFEEKESQLQAQLEDNKAKGTGYLERREQRLERIESRIHEQQSVIETWKQNKDAIVNARVQELIQGSRPFPWHR